MSGSFRRTAEPVADQTDRMVLDARRYRAPGWQNGTAGSMIDRTVRTGHQIMERRTECVVSFRKDCGTGGRSD